MTEDEKITDKQCVVKIVFLTLFLLKLSILMIHITSQETINSH